VILSIFFENSGIMKNGPRLAQFEQSDAKKIVTFKDVQGVDEAKGVREHYLV
jgi:ATP-dependent metalloprotease